jgi:hypothetical protein
MVNPRSDAIEQQPRHFADVVGERVSTLKGLHTAFVEEAITSGVDGEDLRQALADAINAGALPRLTVGPIDRNANVQFYVLDGNVLPDALGVRTLDDPDVERYGPIFITRRPKDEGDFTVTLTPRLPQVTLPVGGATADIATLARVDSYFPQGTFSEAKIIEPEVRPQRDYLEF